MSGTALHTTDRYSLHVVGRLDGPLVLVIAELQLHTRLCIVEEAEYVRRALREARGIRLWIGVEGGRRIKYVLRVTPLEGRSQIRAWYETTKEAERLKISEARGAGELGRVIVDGAILRVLAAHDRYWRESIKTLEAIEHSGDEDDFEMFYDILELSAMRLREAVALTSLRYYTDDLIAVWGLEEEMVRWQSHDLLGQTGGPYSLRWDRRNTDSWRSVEDRNPRTLTDYRARERERDDESWRRRDDDIDRDRTARETYERARRLDDYSRSPHYEVDGGRGDSRGRWESDQGRRDGYRDGRYERLDRDGYRDDKYERSDRDGYRGDRYERGDRDGDRRDDSRGWYDRGGFARAQRDDSRGWYGRGDRRDESRGRYDHGDRRNDSRGRYEQGGSGGDCRNDSRGRNERGGYGALSDPHTKSPDPRAARGSTSRGTDDRPPTPRNSCVYCRGDDHIKRDCPDLKRAIDEGLVVLDDRKYVKWADDLGDVSMFPSMKENVEARRVDPSKGKEPVRSQSIKITFEGDMATTPIRVAATKSARGSTSKKTDTDYVMAHQEELSPCDLL
ncbi:hypothetical protein CBR_g12690 [Chara braunii]|uniref:CCHC-type domain-containing protein n=1 Tax=Chara braunii TaxID=69332 RepID=A0A388KSD2_CHABU|nr:hypothetical protein CBR_g12690 [Chara braunii]|eukprot:GBG72971.1 hypothetical protein CBR_g12690 [Chara braunii]